MDNRYLGKLATLLSVCAILMVGARCSSVRAQQTGPGGVPGGGGAGGGAVGSVFGRTGTIVAATGDYTAAQVTDAADTNAANTFTASQAISTASPRITLNDTNNASHSVYEYDYLGYQVFGNQQAGDTEAIYQHAFHDLVSGEMLGWANSSYLFSGPSTAFSSIGDGRVFLGNGTVYDSTGWLQLSAIGNGATGNTDLRGHITLVSGAGTYTFQKSYAVAPTCVATDSTTAAAVKVFSTTTTLTLSGTGTDVLNYICAD